MLRLSKKTDYAIILLTHLGGTNEPVSAQEISKSYSLPHPMIANILKNLVSSGLIVSSRGKLGGYMLSRSAENINLSEIINATDNPFKLVECCKDEYTCKVHNQCPTKTPLLFLHSKIQKFLEETTLFSIIKQTNLNYFFTESNYEITDLS